MNVLKSIQRRRRLLYLGTTPAYGSYYDPEEDVVYRGLSKYSLFSFNKKPDRDVLDEAKMLNRWGKANYTVDEIKHGYY